VHNRTRLALAVALFTVGLATATAFPGLAAAASGVPQPASYNSLSGVSCVSAADCWAVGSAQDMNNNVVGETLQWNGSSWIAVSSPAAAGALDSISCTSSSSCWAVGNIGNGQSFPRPLIVRWNGSSWTKVPVPQLPQEVLHAISCSSSTNCSAVGTYKRSGRTLALHWNGSKWIHTPTPNPSAKFEQALTTVDCTSAKNCWALGYYYAAPLKPTVTGYLMAIHWNGSTWKLAWTSAPYYGADSSASFHIAVRCTSATNCWTVGYSSLSPLVHHPIVVHWSGRKWAPVKPPKITNASLYGVDCSSTRNCWAVGNVGTFGGTHSLVLHWNGSHWTRVPTPRGNDFLSDVSCSSSTTCWAVGTVSSNNGNLNLALRGNGSTWSSF
jgi:hypothetical protein